MLRPAVLVWLAVTACAAPAGEATDLSAAAAQGPRLTAGAVLMTDYIYRGISYSAHQPSTGAYVDAQYGWLYAWTNFNSVQFATSPAVELTTAVGIRPTLGPFDFDVGAAYYHYPGEMGDEQSSFWEAHATVSHRLTEKLALGATVAYAPDVWQSGAWGTYAAGALWLDLPGELLPAGVGWSLSADLGRALFGRTSLSAGSGLPLPAYTNWRAGLKFSYDVFRLALNYNDTNLSKENCFVLTGDLGAVPGGAANPDNNPTGLRSGLCGAAFTATLGFEIRR